MFISRMGGKLKWVLAVSPLTMMLLIGCKTPGDYSSLGGADAAGEKNIYFKYSKDYASEEAVRRWTAEAAVWRHLPKGLDKEDVSVSCEQCENNPTCSDDDWECTMGIPEAFDGYSQGTYTNTESVRLFGSAEGRAFDIACDAAMKELSAKLGKDMTAENTTKRKITGRNVNGVKCRLSYNVFVGSDERYKGKEQELIKKLGLTSSGTPSGAVPSQSGEGETPPPPPPPPASYSSLDQSYGQGTYCESADLLQTGFYKKIREACKAGQTLSLQSYQIPRDCRNLDGYVIMRNVFNKDRTFTEGLSYIKFDQEVPGCRPLTIDYRR